MPGWLVGLWRLENGFGSRANRRAKGREGMCGVCVSARMEKRAGRNEKGLFRCGRLALGVEETCQAFVADGRSAKPRYRLPAPVTF